jgi:hypothetical protein
MKDSIKSVAWKYVGAMFLEQKDGGMAVSLGRVLLLSVVGVAMWKWGHDANPPDTMMKVLYTLFGYVFGTKVVTAVQDIVGKAKQ